MAAALFNVSADPSKARAISAGTSPGARVHPEVVAVMLDSGLDLSQHKPQFLSEDLARQAQWLITMGCGDECPIVPGIRRDDWPIPDPKGQTLPRVREIRDDVAERVHELIDREGWTRR